MAHHTSSLLQVKNNILIRNKELNLARSYSAYTKQHTVLTCMQNMICTTIVWIILLVRPRLFNRQMIVHGHFFRHSYYFDCFDFRLIHLICNFYNTELKLLSNMMNNCIKCDYLFPIIYMYSNLDFKNTDHKSNFSSSEQKTMFLVLINVG